jgi:hypothetical protein
VPKVRSVAMNVFTGPTRPWYRKRTKRQRRQAWIDECRREVLADRETLNLQKRRGHKGQICMWQHYVRESERRYAEARR